MPSSTSSSERRFVLAFAATLLVLGGTWEAILRQHSGASLEFAIDRPAMMMPPGKGETWLVFGNCLMMTGVSPAQLDSQLGGGHGRTIFNISAHEQSPLAYFDYLRRAKKYPDVIITNVSSWIRSTNFEQEAELVTQMDPLSLAVHTDAAVNAQAYGGTNLSTGAVQRSVEDALARTVNGHVWALGHRYHLFDFAFFAWTLVRTASLENALYQLNIQSWFAVESSDTDGRGFVGIRLRYRDDWTKGLDQMADRYLKRMRFSHMLTDRYWQLLEADIREFQQHGTKVLLVRMPEHPGIREFNDERYAISRHLEDLRRSTGAPVLDLSTLGPADGVRLFDAVHPDAPAAEVITRKLAEWLRTSP